MKMIDTRKVRKQPLAKEIFTRY